MHFAFTGYGHAADPRLIGGHQSYLRRLARYLIHQDHSVDFLIQADEKEGGERVQTETNVHYFASFTDIATRLTSEAYDWVFFSRFPAKHLGTLIHHLRRGKQDSRYGYFYLVMPPSPLMRLTRIALFKLLFDVVVTASPRLQSQVNPWGINSFLLLPPVPNICFDGEIRHRTSKWRVAYMGRIGEDKGLRGLASSFRRLQERYRNVTTEIRGYYDPLSKTSTALHNFLSQGQVPYTGLPYGKQLIASPADEEKVLQWLKGIDILVLPYRRLEGRTIDVPVLLLEAMASGCLVTATGLGDIPSILGDSDLVIRGSILETLSRLIEGGKVRERRENLRKRACQYGVDIESSGEEFLQHLEPFKIERRYTKVPL